MVESVPEGENTPVADCSECGRKKFEHGRSLAVEAAWSDVKAAPAAEQYERMRTSRNKRERERWADLQSRFEYLSIYGELEPVREWRFLQGDLWEIKTANDRAPAYETKATNRHVRTVRVTHIFAKKTGKTADGKTPRKHLNFGEWMIRMDKGL